MGKHQGTTAMALLAIAVSSLGHKHQNVRPLVQHQHVSFQRMWRDLERACAAGTCWRHSNSSASIQNTTDCKGRLLAYEFGLTIQPQRGVQQATFDALELLGCGVQPPHDMFLERSDIASEPTSTPSQLQGDNYFYVDPTKGSDTVSTSGSLSDPFLTIAYALERSRQNAASTPTRTTIYLRGGIHYIQQSLRLEPQDSGLSLAAYEAEKAWVSGGKELSSAKWSRATNIKGNVWQTTVPEGPLTDVLSYNVLSYNAAIGATHVGVISSISTKFMFC